MILGDLVIVINYRSDVAYMFNHFKPIKGVESNVKIYLKYNIWSTEYCSSRKFSLKIIAFISAPLGVQQTICILPEKPLRACIIDFQLARFHKTLRNAFPTTMGQRKSSTFNSTVSFTPKLKCFTDSGTLLSATRFTGFV